MKFQFQSVSDYSNQVLVIFYFPDNCMFLYIILQIFIWGFHLSSKNYANILIENSRVLILVCWHQFAFKHWLKKCC